MTTYCSALFLIVACLWLGCFSGCASSGSRTSADRASYTYVTLTSGPTSGTGTKEERQEMFKGHMANINRLAESGELIIAGPFISPSDSTWRGLFVFDVADPAAAQALVATDPGVIKGEFTPVLRPLTASTTLRQSLALYRAMEAEQKAALPTDPTQPPALMRAYVIVTAKDARLARKAITASTHPIVWCGTFTDGDGKGGVFVLDATDAAVVRTSLKSAATGPCSIDGLFGTSALVRLPEDARK